MGIRARLPAEIKSKLYEALAIRGKSSAPFNTFAILFFGSYLSLFLGSVWALKPYFPFCALIILTSAIRYYICSQFKPDGEQDHVRWYYRYASISLINAVTWGTLTYFILKDFQLGGAPSQLLFLIMSGLAAGAATALTPSPELLRVFIGCLLLIPGLATLTFFTGLDHFFTFAFFFYFAFLIKLSSQNYTTFIANIKSNYVMSLEHEKLQTIIDAVPGYFSYLNCEAEYVAINSNLKKALGLTEEKVVGKKVGFLAKDTRFTEAVKRFTESNLTYECFQIPFNYQGAERWHLLTMSKVGLDKSDTVCVSLDIHEQHLLEQETNVQRGKAQAAAKMATLGEMAGGIAHEINNPLTVVQGFAVQAYQNLEKGKVDPEALMRSLKKIETNCSRIAKIIRGLRSFSRNADADPFIPTKLTLIIEDTLELCRDRFNKNAIDFKTETPPDSVLNCRSTQLSQVLINLLGNAIDAVNGLNEKWVSLTYETTDKDVKIHITDSGNGIPPEIVTKIMQPFFTTKEVGKGTGLGLSISKGIIEDHKGALEVDANSKNTRFTIRLPLLADSKAA